jgi:hypothetical protein
LSTGSGNQCDGVISIEEVLVYERALPTAAPRK